MCIAVSVCLYVFKKQVESFYSCFQIKMIWIGQRVATDSIILNMQNPFGGKKW